MAATPQPADASVSATTHRLAPAPALLILSALMLAWTLLAPLAPSVASLLPAAVLLAVAVAGGDAALSWRHASALRFLSVAPVLRWTENRPATLGLRLHASPQPLARPCLVWHGEAAHACGLPQGLLALPAAPLPGQWDLPAHPRHRGLYASLAARLRQRSRFRLWFFVSELRLPVEIRISPDVRSAWRAVLASPLAPLLEGARRQFAAGAGSDFDRLREYVPGDAATDICWKATARRDVPITRLFHCERAENAYLVLDHSRFTSMPLPGLSPAASVLDGYVDAALAVLTAAQSLEDRLGLALFADDLTHILPAGTGPAHAHALRRLLIPLRHRDVVPEFDHIFIRLAGLIRRRSQLLILTDAAALAAGDALEAALGVIARDHIVSVHAFLPAGVEPLLSDRRPATSVSGVYRRLAGHREHTRLRILRRRLGRRGIATHFTTPGDFSLRLIEAYVQQPRSRTQ